MPFKLIPPKAGRNPVYRVRGTYLGSYIDRSTKTDIRAIAQKLLNAWKAQVERGELSVKQELTLVGAALSYASAGGEKRFLKPILKYFGDKILAREIGQAAIDEAAVALYPKDTPGTRNRQVYTPMSAILRHAGIELNIRRPKGAQGVARNVWLRQEPLEAVFAEAGKVDPELGTLFVFLAYTGLRLSEGLRIRCSSVSLADREALCGKTKNGDPRPVHLPPRLVAALANHPRGLDRGDRRLFRWSKSGELYMLAERAYANAGVDHCGAPFHILRHSYGAMMTRVGADLVGTGAWKSPTAARGYQHFDLSEESRKADLMPGARNIK